MKPFLFLPALMFAGAAAAPQQATQPAPSTALVVPADIASKANPIKPDAESLARAKKIYGYECALCHGDNGGGDGDLAKNMKTKMADFRDPAALKGRTDGELYYIINHGMGEMEGEGARVKPDDTWGLVNYVRSFSHGGQPTAAVQGPS